MLFNYGTCGKTTAGNDHAFWARVEIKDLRYSQDSCSELFSRSPELDCFESLRMALDATSGWVGVERHDFFRPKGSD